MAEMTPAEALVYDAIFNAAERGEVCPLGLDIEMMIGAISTSMGPKMVRKLEEKGLIEVQRFQKYRIVTIVATGRTTARPPSMHVDRPHVPRGMRSNAPPPSDRKHYKQGRL